MILGLSPTDFTFVHVVLSFAALITGGIVLLGLLGGHPLPRITAFFLLATLLASMTGLLFPFTRMGPGRIIGVASILVFAPAALALYRFQLAGSWGLIHVGGITGLVWMNVVIAVLQAFAKLDYLQPLRNTLVPNFAQLVLLALFILLGSLAAEQLENSHGHRRL